MAGGKYALRWLHASEPRTVALRGAPRGGILEPEHHDSLANSELSRDCSIKTECEQQAAARTVVARGLSVRQTEALVRDFEKQKPAKAPVKEDPNVRKLMSELSDRIGAPVAIRQEKGGKGKLVISYNTLDELDGILAHIK